MMRVNRAAVLTGPRSFSIEVQPMPEIGNSSDNFWAAQLLSDRSRRVLAEPPDTWGSRAAVDSARRLTETSRFDPDVEHLVSVAETLDDLYGRTK